MNRNARDHRAAALSGAVYGVRPNDPLTLGGVALALLAFAIVAALGPAWRAARLQPLEALDS